MIKKLDSVHLILLLSVLLSCETPNENSLIKLQHIKDVECIGVPYSIKQVQNSINTVASRTVFTYLNWQEGYLGLYCLNNNGKEWKNTNKKYFFNNLETVTNNLQLSKFYFSSNDSIFQINQRENMIYLYDSLMNTVGEFSIKKAFAPVIYFHNSFFVSENIYFSSISKNNFSFGNKADRLRLFKNGKTICKLCINPFSDSLHFTAICNFPDSYINTGKNFYDFAPSFCIDLRHRIILSYGADDNIYVYNDSVPVSKMYCKSNYIKELNDIPDDKFKDLAFIKKYQAEEPRYKGIYYDPFKKNYYRITELRKDISNFDINKAKWTIIVLDINLTVIGEVLIPYSKYLSDVFVLCEEGIYLKKTPKNDNLNSNIVLSLIKLEI